MRDEIHDHGNDPGMVPDLTGNPEHHAKAQAINPATLLGWVQSVITFLSALGFNWTAILAWLTKLNVPKDVIDKAKAVPTPAPVTPPGPKNPG